MNRVMEIKFPGLRAYCRTTCAWQAVIEDEKGTFEAPCVAVQADAQSRTALRA